tara:strand:+ start:11793 stop:12035 length:243 start_codon:yes stop_codon:yes gene_type:complete
VETHAKWYERAIIDLVGQYNITEELINKLKELFPDKLPRHDIPLDQLRLLQGQQQVVDMIIKLFEESFEQDAERKEYVNV